MITVTINGNSITLDEPMSVQSYLESKDLAERRVAVAVNGEIVRREEYGNVRIEDGATVEIVRPAGGG